MSDFVPTDLWEEILQRHWTFLETEESIKKLEERRKLEGCLKEFLCIVPHDRKFFLTETAKVLKQSIHEMDNFSAYKAINGFEAISQYANNLFTKPWRKEFRVLKLYSGYYKHEVKSNLLNAEILLVAMGYRQISEDLYVLDGPICPDQVTNVSRDAMAAYMECQIMKHIYSSVTAMGLSCTWQDVYRIREKHIGGTSLCIKYLIYAIQEPQRRKDKLIDVPDNLYNQPSVNSSQNCPNCAYYHSAQQHQHQHQQNQQQQQQNRQCMMCGTSYPYVNQHHHHHHQYPMYGAQQNQMSHSRSLEYYNNYNTYDQQKEPSSGGHHHYQTPYNQNHVYERPSDCLDAASMGSSVSYAAPQYNAACSHPYNVSGNRYPLPYNISNQLNNPYAIPSTTYNDVGPNGVAGSGRREEGGYSHIDNNAYTTIVKNHDCNAQQQTQIHQRQHHQQKPIPPVPPTRQSSSVNAIKELSAGRQHYFPPEHLIDFDDKASLAHNDFHALMHNRSGYDYDTDLRRSMRYGGDNYRMYPQDKDYYKRQHVAPTTTSTDSDMYGNCTYARPIPKNNRVITTANKMSLRDNDDYIQECSDNNRKLLHIESRDCPSSGVKSNARRKLSGHGNEREISDYSYDSTLDDYVTVGHSEHAQQLMPRPNQSPTHSVKVQDGVGSYESWDYVFQNLEKSGYTKDLSERGDLLVQSLDLDTMNTTQNTNATKLNDKRYKATELKAGRQSIILNADKHKTSTIDRSNSRQEKGILKHTSNSTQTSTSPTVGPATINKPKSALKSTRSNVTTTVTPPTPTLIYADNNNHNSNTSTAPVVVSATTTSKPKNAATTKTTISNSSGSGGGGGGGVSGGAINSKRSTTSISSSSSSKQKQTSKISTATNPTAMIVTNPNEWSCKLCTFLNPDTKRICEMCCHSKDFKLEETISQHTPTCV